MEGPTPVSALIHAATMVTAGVFLLVRSSALLLVVVELQYFIILVGCFTAFFAASVAVFQNDIKKIIAYSTCSQLGYMFFSCGLLNFDLAFFHLVNHAFFKALLFLSAGVIIHGFSDEQDLRQLGGLSKILPVTYIMVCIGSFALMGFPFFTGFYSKDTILELALGSYTFYGCLAFGLGLLGAILTAFYSSKMLKMTFLVKPHNKYKMLISHEGSNLILSVLIILSFFSVIIGYVLRELFIGIGVDC